MEKESTESKATVPGIAPEITESVKLINGNGRPYVLPLPKLVMLGKINNVARDHIADNTGLYFRETCGGYEAIPERSNQITALLLTYNFKTRYFNNLSVKNTLFLKSDHHQGFNVDSICFDCCEHNHIHLNGLKQGDRLAC